jgi:SH2 domain
VLWTLGESKFPTPVVDRTRARKAQRRRGTVREGEDEGPTLHDVAGEPIVPEMAPSDNVYCLVLESMITNYEQVFAVQIALEEQDSSALPLWRSRVSAHVKGVSGVRGLTDEIVVSWSHSEIRLWHVPAGFLHPMRLTTIENGEENDLILDLLPVRSFVENSGSLHRVAEQVHRFLLWVSSPTNVCVWDVRVRGEYLLEGARPNFDLPVLAAAPQCIKQFPGMGCFSLVKTPNLLIGSTCNEPRLVLWDFGAIKEEAMIPIPAVVTELAVVREQIWGGVANGDIFVWTLEAAGLRQLVHLLGAESAGPDAGVRHGRKVRTFASVDSETGFGSRVVWSGSDDGIICIWESTSFELLHSFDTHAGKISQLTFKCGLLWCCTWAGSVRVFSDHGEMTVDLKGQHTDGVTGLSFCFDRVRGRWRFVTSSYDHTLSVWLLPKEMKEMGGVSDEVAVEDDEQGVEEHAQKISLSDLLAHKQQPSVAAAPASAPAAAPLAAPVESAPAQSGQVGGGAAAFNTAADTYSQIPSSVVQQPVQSESAAVNTVADTYSQIPASVVQEPAQPAPQPVAQSVPQTNQVAAAGPAVQTNTAADIYAKFPSSTLAPSRSVEIQAVAGPGTQNAVSDGAYVTFAVLDATAETPPQQPPASSPYQTLPAASAAPLDNPLCTGATFETYPWFHPQLSGPDSELLLCTQPPGSFLFRYSSQPGLLAASYVLATSEIQSALVGFNSSHVWNADEPEELFQSLPELIKGSSHILVYPVPR